MEQFLHILALISGPVVGALIGLVTNYIAVKMLFRPYQARYIGKLRIPFTPGIIPRRQQALAGALGHMIADTLVREEDLQNALLSKEVTDTVVSGILTLPPLRESGHALAGEGYDALREKLVDALTDRVVAGISGLNISGFIAKEGYAALAASGGGKLLTMFLNENTVAAMAPGISEKLLAYLAGDGREKIRELLIGEVGKLEEKPIGEMLGDPAATAPVIESLYRRLVTEHAEAITRQFRIADTVKEKISAMSPRDLETLVLSVMKKELNAVIYLGALIGFVLGIINLLF